MKSKHRADGESGEEVCLAFTHSVGIAEPQDGQRSALDLEYCQVMGRIDRPSTSPTDLRRAVLRAQGNGEGFVALAVEPLRQHIFVRHDAKAVTDRKAGP